MINKKQKIIVLLFFIQIFIYPISNLYAENILPASKLTAGNKTNFKLLNNTSPNLRILNLNTMLIPFELVAPAYRERGQELKNFIIKDFDIVLLQEVFSKKTQQDFIEKWYLAKDLSKSDTLENQKIQVYEDEILNQRPNDIKVSGASGMFYVSGPKRKDLKTLFGSGLLLLSKYPIIYSNVFCFKDRAGTDVFASKGVIYAKIKTGESDNEYIHFFATHIQSHGYINVRQKNIEEFFSFVSKIMSDEIKKTNSINPVIITGDFNVPANNEDKEISPEYIFLTEKIDVMCQKINSTLKNGSFYLKDLWVEKNPGNLGYTWIAKDEEEIKNSPYGEIGNTIAIEKKGAERIDYIFYFEGGSSFKTESLNINLVPKKPEKIYSFKNGKLKSYTLSDHLGLDAVFKIIK